ncbi:IclR family transcriptional regulator [Klenkia taihuensis]|uniref:Glycerol operon regulatory protein n=1 Tax=Klenkia taihuensis TaxID=1225127 RepID=A0A1I1Q5S7_9ACTN|nr:helix-turn-helix domain-containing protein [Klenkia taihuensis]GHE08131.1 transcriptional regulator [Klenkia taihuensis]SFD17385.1 transcriptional regulator, IclR family [Klenkia taihuensis]
MADPVTAPQSQTLDRGLRILEHLAATGSPRPVMEIATAVGLHRSITYRLLRTLEDRGFVERDDAGRFGLGLTVSVLARGVRTSLQAAATARLTPVVERFGCTGFLVVRAGDDAVTLTSVEPRDVPSHVTRRPGTRHPVGRGAPGLALLMPDPPSDGDRPELVTARATGWAVSEGEVIPGVRSVSAPVLGPDGAARAAVAVVHTGIPHDVADVGAALVAAAAAVAADAP